VQPGFAGAADRPVSVAEPFAAALASPGETRYHREED